ncbi:MAG: thioesterase family protein [Acidimicrobiales bacterium]
MDLLHKTEVTPDQIDHLGHMNVRFYADHARTGADALLASIGLTSDDGRTVVGRDIYVRHHREQLVGAALEVRGGVLDASADRIRLYEELVNPDAGEVAASFVLSFELADRSQQGRLTIDPAVVDEARSATVTLPEHGRPRSISLDDDPTERPPALEVLRERDLALRQIRVIDDEADDDGIVASVPVAELVWGGEPVPGSEFRPLEPLASGGSMGFATMETRATWARPARRGDRVQSFGAQLDIQAKTMLSSHWLVDVDRGDLVAVFSVLNVGFDTATRRAIVIPDDVRRRISSRLHPDLAAVAPGG